MAINAFTVVSEFKFDVANAIIGTDKLTKKVDQLESSVAGALNTVKAMGIGFVANFTGANAGILGLLSSAIGMSDKFSQSQLSFVQIIDSNMAHLKGNIGSINEQMLVSRRIMGDIATDARKFGLPADELMNMTKTLSAMLVPKGLAGENFGQARSLSRNLLKSAPNLGIDPSLVQGQMLRAIEGSASMGDTLFRRLITEAPEAFKANNVKDAKGFNTLGAAKRVEILNKSLAKFANNAKILEMRANTLSGVMQSASDLFRSFNSVLRPFGDILMPLIVKTMQMLIDFIDKQGREMVKAMARFIKPMIEGPKEMLLNFMFLDGLAGDIAMSAGIVSLIVTLTHFRDIMHGLSTIPYISTIVAPLQKLFNFFMNMPVIGRFLRGFMDIFKLGPITGATGLLKGILLTIGRMIGLFGILLIPIMGLSRAINRMKLDSLAWLGNNMASIIDMFTSLKNSMAIFFAPISDMITGFEELFYTMFGGTAVLDMMKSGLSGLTDLLKTLSSTFLELYAAVRGMIAGLTAIVAGILQGDFKNFRQKFLEFGSQEFEKTVNRFRAPTLGPEGEENAKVVNQVNNYDVTMNNSFKEVLQPDRIAFTIQDQLEKASQNRRSTRGFSSAAKQSGAI